LNWLKKNKVSVGLASLILFASLIGILFFLLFNQLNYISSKHEIRSLLKDKFNVTSHHIGKVEIKGISNPHLIVRDVNLSHEHWGTAKIDYIKITPKWRSFLLGDIKFNNVHLASPVFTIKSERIHDLSIQDITTKQTALSRLLLDPMKAPKHLSIKQNTSFNWFIPIEKKHPDEFGSKISFNNAHIFFEQKEDMKNSKLSKLIESLNYTVEYKNIFSINPAISIIARPKILREATENQTWQINLSALHSDSIISDLRMEIDTPFLNANFEGETTLNPGIDPVGKLKFNFIDAEKLAEYFDMNISKMPLAENIKIDTDVNTHKSSINFSNLSISSNGNNGVGQFSLNFSEEQPKLLGTIALDIMHLAEYYDIITQDSLKDNPWVLDLDIRFSTNNLILHPYDFKATAGNIRTKKNEISISFNNTNSLSGAGYFLFKRSLEGDAELFSLEGSIQNTEFAKLLDKLGYQQRLAGNGFLKFKLQNNAFSWPIMLDQFSGDIDIFAKEGFLNYIDFDSKANAGTPNVFQDYIADNKIYFDSLELSAQIKDRKLVIPELLISKDNVILSSSLTTDISTKNIQGNGYIRLENSPLPNHKKIQSPAIVSIPFYIGGDYDDIKIDFD